MLEKEPILQLEQLSPFSGLGRDSTSTHKTRIILNPQHDSGLLTSYKVSPQWITFGFPSLEDWHHGCAVSDLQQARMPAKNLSSRMFKAPRPGMVAAAWAGGAPSDSVTTEQIRAWPVINFNEWSKTRGQSWNSAILLELILCLT